MKERIIKVGSLSTGKLNHICDVPGVIVGHQTIIYDDIRTGVTAILPHGGNLFCDKVMASCYVMNGFGKSVGLMQIEELGEIETPIMLTNTLAVGRVSDALVQIMVEENREIGLTQGTVNPIVLECNDGRLNNIRKIVIDKNDVEKAIKQADTNTLQGSVGAGAGMICHGLKGGIGSSSRQVVIEDKVYTLGVLVNSNFGHSSSKDLIVNGKQIGQTIYQSNHQGEEDKGSIIVVVATDIGLDSNGLRRVVKRASIGIGRTGSYIGHGSGDVFVGFSTTNIISNHESSAFVKQQVLTNNHINLLFQAVVEATEEAIYHSMLYSPEVNGYCTNVKSLQTWLNELK
jgi:D-aminopeptidase